MLSSYEEPRILSHVSRNRSESLKRPWYTVYAARDTGSMPSRRRDAGQRSPTRTVKRQSAAPRAGHRQSNSVVLAPLSLAELKSRDIPLLLVILLSGSHVLSQSVAEVYTVYLVAGLVAALGCVRSLPQRNVFLFLFGILTIGGVGAWAWPDKWNYLKISIGMCYVVLTSALMIAFYRRDVRRIFRIYLTAGFVASVMGMVQVTGYVLGVPQVYNFRLLLGLNKWALSPGGPLGLRLNSVYSEPSQFCIVLSGCAFWAVYVISFRRCSPVNTIKAVVILVAFCMTFSAMTIPALACASLFVLTFSKVHLTKYFQAIVVGGLLFAAFGISEISDRADGVWGLVSGQSKTGEVHGSSEILVTHLRAALYSVERSPFFGAGLGMHQSVYWEYISVSGSADLVRVDWNAADANSMLLRVASELGLIGVAGLVFLVCRGWIRPRGNSDNLRIISCAFLCVITLQAIRQGNYFFNYFPMFFLLYLEAKRQTQGVELRQRVSMKNLRRSRPALASSL